MADNVIKDEVKSLTAFRFIAAFYVFLFHLQSRAPIFGDGPFGAFISEGAVGMTMFFVLSGFILTYAYDSITLDIKSYFWNRIARIYPIYLLAAILALPWLGKELIASESVPYAIAQGLILLIFGLLLLQAWLPQTFAFWNNGASWSISNEAFFYSMFPFARNLMQEVSTKWLISLFIVLSMISSMIPVASIVFDNAPESFSLWYALPFFRFPEFLCGMIAYKLMIRIEWTSAIRNTLVIILILGVTHVVILGKLLPGYTLHNWIIIGSVASALILLLQAEKRGSKLFTGAVPVWLGQISYCFYSFQFHVLEGLRWAIPINEVGGLVYSVIATFSLLIIAAVAHHFVEEPARMWIKKRTRVFRSIERIAA